jgi:hypothetical protein
MDMSHVAYVFFSHMGHVIVLCLIQHITRHVMGLVLDHMLGHVTGWGLGGHVMWFSQGHVVGDAPSALDYSWALGPGLGDLVSSSGTGLWFGLSRASLATASLVFFWGELLSFRSSQGEAMSLSRTDFGCRGF